MPDKLQDLRRADGAGGEHQFAARPQACLLCLALHVIGHTDHAAFTVPIEQQSFRMGVGDDLQVRAAACRIEVSDRAGATPAVSRGQLEVPGPFLLCAVEVVVTRDADLAGPGDEGVADVALHPHIRNRKRPTDAVVVVTTALLVFGHA